VYIVQCDTAIGVVLSLPFLGVSSLNFGPLATAAFFLADHASAPSHIPDPCPRPVKGVWLSLLCRILDGEPGPFAEKCSGRRRAFVLADGRRQQSQSHRPVELFGGDAAGRQRIADLEGD
jgi:hypothetical protein